MMIQRLKGKKILIQDSKSRFPDGRVYKNYNIQNCSNNDDNDDTYDNENHDDIMMFIIIMIMIIIQ